MGVGSQSLEGAAIVGYARQSPGSPRQHGVASRFNVRSACNSFRRPQIHPRAVGKFTSVTICRELKHSDQTIKSEHVGTDRRRKNRYFHACAARPMTPRACPAWGWGRKALKAQPSSATRGRARITAPARCCLALQCPQRPQFIPAPANSSPSSWKLTSVTICRELRHSDQTIKSEHVGTDRRRKDRLLLRASRLHAE